MVKLVQDLFEGPIDVIGDVHGEAGALFALLDLLGYDAKGHHPENRRLVFVGDLVDRGPDSVSVVRFVKKLVEDGQAQMVLGNHEINLMKSQKKHGSHWFYGEPEVIRKDKKAVSFQLLADDNIRKEFLDFFSTLPLVLERSDCRVVHACWNNDAVDKLRNLDEKYNAAEAFYHYADLISNELEELSQQLDSQSTDEEKSDQNELLRQNGNPVLIICSGPEERAPAPYYAGGKMRRIDREQWWEKYDGDALCCFGHYWRLFPQPASTPQELKEIRLTGRDLFHPVEAQALLGPKKTAMCLDFAVGLRYEERGFKLPAGGLGTHLAALRLPEKNLYLEDGQILETK